MARLIGKLTRLALLAGVVAAVVTALRGAGARGQEEGGQRVPMSFDQWPAVPHAAGNGAG